MSTHSDLAQPLAAARAAKKLAQEGYDEHVIVVRQMETQEAAFEQYHLTLPALGTWEPGGQVTGDHYQPLGNWLRANGVYDAEDHPEDPATAILWSTTPPPPIQVPLMPEGASEPVPTPYAWTHIPR